MRNLRKRVLYELTREPKERTVSFQNFAGRLLIGFFILMFIFTFVSKAADSVTVAKVRVATIFSGELKFKIEGYGSLEENTQKYLHLYEGVKVEDCFVKEGQNIVEGEPLLQYNINDLGEKKEDFEIDLAQAEYNLERDKLDSAAEYEQNGEQAAEFNVEQVEFDLEYSKEDLEAAKLNINKEKKEAYEEAERIYKEAVEAYEELVNQKNKLVTKAIDDVANAKEELYDLYEEKRNVETRITNLETSVKSKNNTSNTETTNQTDAPESADVPGTFNDIMAVYTNVNNKFFDILHSIDSTSESVPVVNTQENLGSATTISIIDDPVILAINDIFIEYYGKEEYESHLKAVNEAKKSVDRTKEDYTLSILISAEAGTMPTTTQKLALMRAYEDANEALAELTKDDTQLAAAISAYGEAVMKDSELDKASAYAALFNLLYVEDSNTLKLIKNANYSIDQANDTLNEIITDKDEVVAKEADKVSKAQSELDKANVTYEQTLNNTYDYSQDLRMEERTIESSQRAVEEAKTNLEQAKISDKNGVKNDKDNKKLEELDLELREEEIQKIGKDMEEVTELINNKGIVTSLVSGVLAKLTVEEGSLITGTEKVIIATGDFGFKAKVTEDEAKRLSLGDEINIQVGSSKEVISIPIEEISSEDGEGLIEISGVMPEGNYSTQSKLKFDITKESERYDQIVPIQAIRQDMDGFYCLVTQESSTVLGNELTAYRKPISLIDKDYTKAAIDNGLSLEDQIIISSNKNIEEGDRVRIE